MTFSQLDSSSPIPLYQQLVVALKSRISSGEVPAGSFLPGELDLCEEFGVSRITAKRALDELAAAGLVTRARGRGTKVSDRAGDVPVAVQASIEGWLETVGQMQQRTSVQLLGVRWLPATQEIADALELAAGEEVHRSVRVRSLDGAPMSYLTVFLPGDLAHTIRTEELGEAPLLKLLERAGHRVTSAAQTITANAAAPDVARALAVDVGAPLLDVRRTVRNAAGRPIQYIRALYRPELYQIEMSLTRVSDRDGLRWSADATAPSVERIRA